MGSPHPLLQLLGLSDQELQEQMAKGYNYAFNMGNNHTIPFQDFQEAGKELMKRNMPEVLDNSQAEAVFMPEAHLPNMPRIVDEQRYQERKKTLNNSTLEFLGIPPGKVDKKGEKKPSTDDVQVFIGDLVEKE